MGFAENNTTEQTRQITD